MQLVSAHINPLGNFLLGLDTKQKYHGVFCWSAEQVARYAQDWRLNTKEERALALALIDQNIDPVTVREPQEIHGIGAAVIRQQFSTVQEVRSLVPSDTTVNIEHGRVYYRTRPVQDHAREAALLFYVTPEGESTLAHLRTQDQAAELLYEDWVNEAGKQIIQGVISTLPEFDPAFLHPTYIHGPLIQQLITAQLLYKRLFPDDPTARN